MNATRSTVLAVLASLTLALPTLAGTLKCPPDSAKVGNACIDLYEASVWQIDPVANAGVVKRVQAGKATLADLTAAGATQLSPSPSCSPGFPANFPASGQWTPIPASNPPSPGVYAVSIPGVQPSACIDWFQASQACRLSGKRLATNLEWQDAVAGTPDPGATPGANDCNTSSAGPSSTGSRTNCKSSWGAFDMVGNEGEWVADWADRATVGFTDWTTVTGLPGNDFSLFGGNGSGAVAQIPGALARGGDFVLGAGDGVFMVSANNPPTTSNVFIGFRCAH
jgi:formylglycine-generating enzyme required for sulfatase activity